MFIHPHTAHMHTSPQLIQYVPGTTDSEMTFALFLNQIEDSMQECRLCAYPSFWFHVYMCVSVRVYGVCVVGLTRALTTCPITVLLS